MGMSASQARYLSLTARKSDLEFRGQQINQSRLMLSNQSANLYSSMLSMSVPTPPVETDFMKDVYSFSMGGDNTTLSSYKLSMGKDGYGYDILYSKPATTKQLAASSVSNVQRAISRNVGQKTNIVSSMMKIKTTYDNSNPQSKSSPNVSRLVNMKNATKYKDRGNSKLSDAKIQGKLTEVTKPSNSSTMSSASMYNTIHGKKVTEVTKPSKNSTMSSSSVAKMTNNGDTITYNYGTKDSRTLHKLSANNVCDIFGGQYTSNTFTYKDSLLSKILEGFGDSNSKVTVGVSGGAQKNEDKAAGKGNVSFYIDAENMKFYVMKAQDGSDNTCGNNIFDSNNSINASTSVYEYNLVDLLGLSVATNVKVATNDDNMPEDNTVYYNDYGTDSNTVRDYYIFGWDKGFYFQTATGVKDDGWKIDDHDFYKLKTDELNNFGITANNNQDGTSSQSDKTYQYFRDSSNGDIWELCTTTDTNGGITESWKLFQANKTYNIGEKEAQLIDEKDWPQSGIDHTMKNGQYDCYYIPDEAGTGGSYYLIPKNAFTYGETNADVTGDSNKAAAQYEANNTFKIEGMTACVVSDNSVPSTIAEAYNLDNYIIYATYNDSDTDFSNPIKYYVYPKDEDSADAVCSYAFEKSYTGKNQILEGRANILVDENGRLSKLDIQGEGTYTLEYGQEKDEEAYNEAYREYEYKLEKYEKEMADIDARTAIIQQQDKKLELQLKSIDTEHSAIQTELEALKKVIDNNIKSGFGTFGG